MKDPKQQAPGPSGHFIAMLQGKTSGVSLPELDAELAELVNEVRDTGRAGTLTYKVKVSRNARAGVKIEDEVSVKLPKGEAGVSFFFVGDGGALLRNDPNQMDIPFKAVPDDASAAPKVAGESAAQQPKQTRASA